MFKKPIFWIFALLLALACAWLSLKFFRQTIPHLELEITMDRATALQHAELLAKERGWGPEHARSAVAFQTDQSVKTYVELEAGGVDAFRSMITEGVHQPYFWEVRLFREREAREVRVRFTPQGTLWGFWEKVPESEPGATLSADQARALAEESAVEVWDIDLATYVWVEGSETLRPGGRVDHTLTYEHSGEKAGEAPYRLQLVVSGDRFTALQRFVRVPETFERRYEEMRSANQTLTQAGTIVLLLVFVVGGCGFGLFVMLRARAIIWRAPVVAGVVVGLLSALTVVNSSDLAWMGYDTAVSYQHHTLLQILSAGVVFLSVAFGTALVLMAAETLTRQAFPQHVQFWKLWKPGVVNTRQVLAMTAGAFIIACVNLGYSATFFHIAITHLGWWSPAAEQFDPNVLALHWPWLTALHTGLMPGLTEEALFRAIPLAGAVLLGRRYGRVGIWVAVAFVLQALVFASVHANYPQQPYYFRLVELILPALGFGLIYGFIGLYPAVLVHAWFNFTLSASVLFSVQAPGMVGNRVMLIIVGLLPVWVILFGWLRQRTFASASVGYRNQDWEPPAEKLETPEANVETPSNRGEAFWQRIPVLLLGIVIVGALIAWGLARPFDKETEPLTVTRAEAIAAAEAELQARGIALGDDWEVLCHAWKGPWHQHQYVLETGGKEAYESLSEHYLHGIVWEVKWITFEGSVEERAEQFRIFVTHDERIFGFRHTLPEDRAGARLEEGQAKQLAEAQLQVHYGERWEELELISARSTSHPNRTDWTVSFADPEASVLGKQEARFEVHIHGDEVSGWGWHVHVPEEWSREFRERQNAMGIIGVVSGLVIALGMMAGAIVGFVKWASRKMGVAVFLWTGIGMSVVGMMGLFLNLPEILSQQLSTAQPYGTQVGMIAAFGIIGSMIMAGLLASIVGMIARWRIPTVEHSSAHRVRIWLLALAVALVVSVVRVYLHKIFPGTQAQWGNTNAVASALPWLSVVLQPIRIFMMSATCLFLLFGLVNHLSMGWHQRRVICGLLLLAFGWVVAGTSSETMLSWAVQGGVIALMVFGLYVGLLRFHMPILIPVLAFTGAIEFIASTIPPMHPGAGVGAVLGVTALMLLSGFWYRTLEVPTGLTR